MYKSKKKDISIILTGYNEGECLLENLERVRDTLSDTRYSWEIILYDDKSRDDTPEVFRKFAKENINVRAYYHRKNTGRGGTVMDAVKMSKGEIVGYIDTDLELSPIFIPDAIRLLCEGADLAIATRIYTVGAWNLVRAVFTKGYILLSRIMLGLSFKDTEAGFKFFNAKKLRPILKNIKNKGWFFDTEIVARSHLAGLKIVEIPVLYIPRHDKQSSVNLLKDSLEYFRKLLEFRKEMRK